MCDYSLHSVRSQPAKVGDRLVTRDFGTGTRGFALVDDRHTAVCLLPGTEIAFTGTVAYQPSGPRIDFWRSELSSDRMAIFRQVNADRELTHHDAVEFPDGKVVLLTYLREGQEAIVLQLPATPRTAEEVEAQQRVPVAG